jgi:hypothetical protein
MKSLLIAVSLIAISTAALAQGAGPTVQVKKCWATTDTRGFGYWDACASGAELIRENDKRGYEGPIPRARSQGDVDTSGGAGGGGGGGGG